MNTEQLNVKPEQPAAEAQAENSGLAIASLVLGILSLVCIGVFGAIPGAICGHLALSRIKSSNGALRGRGMAIAGLVMSYISIVLTIVGIIVMCAFFAVGMASFASAMQHCAH